MAWKVEVIADNSGKWVSNRLLFATKKEAECYAVDLHSRWMAVREKRVTEVAEEATHTFNRVVEEIAQ
jgi:hypothetical protein